MLEAGADHHILTVPFEERALAQALGARYVTGTGWVYTGPTIPDGLRGYLPTAYSWDAWLQDDLDGRVLAAAPPPDHTTGTITPRPDQASDAQLIQVARASGAPEFLNANDVGTGKTIIAIHAVKSMANVRNVLVVCPLPVAAGWRDHLRRMGDGGKRWCVINYESTKKLLAAPPSAATAKKQRTRNLRIVREGTPKVQWDVVIADESHALGNPESQQTRVLDKVVAGPKGTPSAFVLHMSATAGADPSQLSYLHRGLAWRTGAPIRETITADEYVSWCETYGFQVDRSGYGNALKWHPNGGDLRKMHMLLFKGAPAWATRRPLPWGDPPYVPQPLSITGPERTVYETEWQLFHQAMEQLKRIEDRAAADPSSMQNAALGEARARGAAAQMRYQQKIGLIKARSNVEFSRTLLENGRQVAISARFTATVNALVQHFAEAGIECATFTGQNRETREAERLAFQRGEKRVIVFTPTEGFNLQANDAAVEGASSAPRVTLIAEPRWSPRAALQVPGRAHRNGEAAPVYFGYAEGTIDERVMKRCTEGMRNMKMMMGDSTGVFAGLAEALRVPMVLDT